MERLRIFLRMSLPLLIFLFVGVRGSEDGFDRYRWVPVGQVSEEQRLKRPDGVDICGGASHLISLVRIEWEESGVPLQPTVGDYSPTCVRDIYYHAFNKDGTGREGLLNDFNRYKVALLVHDLDSLSWIKFKGKLPAIEGLVHVGKYKSGKTEMHVGVCRGFGYAEGHNQPGVKRLFVGKYLWTWDGSYTSNACIMHSGGKEVRTQYYEVLVVNLIGRSTKDPRKGHRIYPAISPEFYG